MTSAFGYVSQRFHSWYSVIDMGKLFGLHYGISTLGVIGVYFGIRSYLTARYSANAAQHAIDADKYFDWLKPYHFPTHKYAIYAYAIAVAILGIIFVAASAKFLNKGSGNQLQRSVFKKIIFFDLFAVILMSAMFTWEPFGPWSPLVGISVWSFATVLPAFLGSRIHEHILRVLDIHAPSLLILIFLIEFIVLIGYFASSRALFFNEYVSTIPSYTWLKEEKSGQPVLVDNIDYFNSNRIWGHLLVDPRKKPGVDPECGSAFTLSDQPSAELRKYIQIEKDSLYLRSPTGEACFYGVMPKEKLNDLVERDLITDSAAKSVLKNNSQFFLELSRRDQELSKKREMQRFLGENSYEMHLSANWLEGTFHHHFQFLNPIKEISLGRPMNEVISLYGLSILPLYAIMTLSGDVTYQSFLAAIYSIYIVYFVLLIVVLKVVFRDLRYVAFIALMSMALVKSLGYVTLFTGLGYSPVRHFNDIFLILSFFLYLTRLNSGWLVAAVVAALLGVLLDRIFGAFGFVALMSVLIIKNLLGQGRPMERWAIIAGVFCFAAVFWISGTVVAPNPYVGGFLDGVWGFPGGDTRMLIILLGSSGMLISIAWLIGRGVDNRIYFPLFLVVYFQVLAFYWLVIPNYGHWYTILPIALMAAASLMRFGFSDLGTSRVKSYTLASSLAVAVLFSLHASYRLVQSFVEVNKVEASHKIFDWPFPNTKIRSTMDPQLFIESVGLINRWAPDNGVFIVSRFDTLITWLGEKYSLMPHFDLISFLNGPAAHEKVVEFIAQTKPDIIFVDSCVECDSNSLGYGRGGLPGVPYVFMSLIAQNSDRLSRLGDVFRAISDDYYLVERGGLLSVYKRKVSD